MTGCDCKPKTPLVKQVLRHSQAKGSARLALLVIAAHYGKESVDTWPGLPLIAQLMGDVDVRTAMRAVRELEELGEITVRRTQGLGNRYALTTSVSHDRGTRVTPDRGTSVTHDTGATPDTPVSTDTPPVSPATPPTPVTADTLSTNGKTPIKRHATAAGAYEEIYHKPPSPNVLPHLERKATEYSGKLQELVERMRRTPLAGKDHLNRLDAAELPKHYGQHTNDGCRVCQPELQEPPPTPPSPEQEHAAAVKRKAIGLWMHNGGLGSGKTADDYLALAEQALQEQHA